MLIPKENLLYWLSKMLEKEDLLNYSFQVSDFTWFNYFSDIKSVSIEVEKDNTKIVRKFIIKSPKINEFTKNVLLNEIHLKECKFYSNILLPKISRTLHFSQIPKNDYSCSEISKQVIIFEDLRKDGFELFNNKSPMNLDHVLLVIKGYAQFHGLSYIFKENHPEEFDKFAKEIEDSYSLGNICQDLNLTKDLQAQVQQSIMHLRHKGYGDIANQLSGFENEIENLFLYLYTPLNSSSIVICQNSCFINNFMFKYLEKDLDKKNPIDIKFLDFQTIRMGSPAFDLLSFLYTCTKKSIFRNFDLILDTYYTTLSTFLKSNDCEIENYLSFKDLKREVKLYAKYALCFPFLFLKLQFCDANDLQALLENNKLDMPANLYNSASIKMQEQYYDRLKDILVHYVENFC